MAISDSQKIDYLWKKLGYGATKTDTNALKKAPNEAIASSLLLRGDKVWKAASSIPSTIPGSSAGVVTVYTTSAPQECTEDITSTAKRTWKTGLTDWISPEIGSTYQVKVYIHTSGSAGTAASGGTQVFATGSGNDDEWFFDYQSGVLHFIGSNLPNGVSFTGKSVYISGARYTGDFGVGGDTGDFTFSTNVMSTSTTNGNIQIDPDGTGQLQIVGTNSIAMPNGTTAQRPGSPSAGDFRYNSTTNKMEYYNGTTWVELESSNYALVSSDSFTGDDSTTAFTLSSAATTNSVIVNINGALQQPTTAYSVSGTTLTMVEAPHTDDIVEVRIFSTSLISTQNLIADADNDTRIRVEASTDEDVIRFDTAGSERFTINASGLTVTGTLNTHTIPSGTGTFALKKTPQIVTSTTSRNTTSSSFVDVTGYTASLTTTEANSKLRVSVNVTRSGDAGKIKLVRTVGVTNTDIIEIPFLTGDGNFTISYIDSPSESASTSVTYKLQHATNGSGTVYVNFTGTNNQIAIEEL